MQKNTGKLYEDVSYVGAIFFGLAVFLTGLDTDWGLIAFVILLCVMVPIILIDRGHNHVLPIGRFRVPIYCFIFTYVSLLFSEWMTQNTAEAVIKVAISYSPVALGGAVALVLLKRGLTFEKAVLCVAICAILYGIGALGETIIYQVPRVAFGYNPIPLGMISVQMMFWCAVGLFYRHPQKMVLLVGGVFSCWAAMLTGSRIPTVVAELILIVLLIKHIRVPVFWVVFLIANLGMYIPVVVGVLEQPYIVLKFLNFFTSIIGEDQNLSASSYGGFPRKFIWQTGFNVIAENPWFGVGSKHDAWVSIAGDPSLRNFRHYHNEIIDVTARFGILSSGAMILSYASVFLAARSKEQLLVVFCFLAQLFLLTLTDVMWKNSITLSMFVFTMVTMYLFLNRRDKEIE
ncbi:MAG: O-antigen ligase family protein [Halocynthiibacter sp.]